MVVGQQIRGKSIAQFCCHRTKILLSKLCSMEELFEQQRSFSATATALHMHRSFKVIGFMA